VNTRRIVYKTFNLSKKVNAFWVKKNLDTCNYKTKAIYVYMSFENRKTTTNTVKLKQDGLNMGLM